MSESNSGGYSIVVENFFFERRVQVSGYSDSDVFQCADGSWLLRKAWHHVCVNGEWGYLIRADRTRLPNLSLAPITQATVRPSSGVNSRTNVLRLIHTASNFLPTVAIQIAYRNP